MMMKSKIVIVIFLCFLGGVGVLNFFSEDRHFSEQENRILAQMPIFSMERFLSGEFAEEFEAYITDQFSWKESWLALKSAAEKVLLKKEHNNVFFAQDDFLLERFEKPGEQLQRNIKSMTYFANKAKEIPISFLLIPTSVEIYQEKLPMYAQSFSQKQVITQVKEELPASIQMIDVYDALWENKNKYLYFRTDHHWTMRGAYEAYIVTTKAMGLKPYLLDDFAIETVSTSFLGTLYSKANSFGIRPDEIEVFYPTFPVIYKVAYDEDTSIVHSLYESSYLTKKDQYSFFLNGNHSLVKIQSSVENGRRLLIIKDSYAHIFIPFLANHFEEIHVVDLRYFHANLYAYMEEHSISESLFLYNVSNFSTDSNMVWLQQ